MGINLNSAGLLTKLGIDHFVKYGGGRFVYIGSRAVFRGETEEYLAYAASKGGLVSLARSVARSFGKQHIKILYCSSRIYPYPDGRRLHSHTWRKESTG